MVTVNSKEEMYRLSEADLRKRVIIPLMEKMGFHGVNEWHGGARELGKDVIGWKESDFGSRTNIAVVAKAVRISGKHVHEVTRQVRQALNTSFEDPVTHDIQQVHRVVGITNKGIPTDSVPGIRSDLSSEQNRHVELIDGNELWRRWTKTVFQNLPTLA
jgi:hypothetical protein